MLASLARDWYDDGSIKRGLLKSKREDPKKKEIPPLVNRSKKPHAENDLQMKKWLFWESQGGEVEDKSWSCVVSRAEAEYKIKG